MELVTISRHRSPLGDLTLGSVDGKLCLCDWTTGQRHNLAAGRLQRITGAVLGLGMSPVIEKAKLQLDEYFAGARHCFDIPLMFAGTEFQRQVWDVLTTIPYGITVTYAEVAARVGRRRAVRAVAGAIAANPLVILAPCHRVIGSDGTLTGYRGGLETKTRLLRLERAIRQRPRR